MPLKAPKVESHAFSLPDFLFIKTSNSAINLFLGGGFLRGSVAGIYGMWGSGKSQICADLAENCAAVGGSVGVIDSDAANGWNLPLVTSILLRLGVTIPDMNALVVQGILTGNDALALTQQYRDYIDQLAAGAGITIYRPESMEELEKTVKNVTSSTVYDLLIVDSLTLYYKDNVTATRGESKEYGGQYLPTVAKITMALDRYAKSGATVIVTAQRLSEIGLEKKKKLSEGEEYREYVGTDVPGYKFNTLIEVKKEGATFRAFLHKNRGNPADPSQGVVFNAVPGGIA